MCLHDPRAWYEQSRIAQCTLVGTPCILSPRHLWAASGLLGLLTLCGVGVGVGVGVGMGVAGGLQQLSHGALQASLLAIGTLVITTSTCTISGGHARARNISTWLGRIRLHQ